MVISEKKKNSQTNLKDEAKPMKARE